MPWCLHLCQAPVNQGNAHSSPQGEMEKPKWSHLHVWSLGRKLEWLNPYVLKVSHLRSSLFGNLSLKYLCMNLIQCLKNVLYSHSPQTCLPQCDFRSFQMIENGDLEERDGHGYLRSGKRVLKKPEGGHWQNKALISPTPSTDDTKRRPSVMWSRYY